MIVKTSRRFVSSSTPHTPEVIAELPGYSGPRVHYYGSYSAQSGVQTIYGGLSGGYGQYLSVLRLVLPPTIFIQTTQQTE